MRHWAESPVFNSWEKDAEISKSRSVGSVEKAELACVRSYWLACFVLLLWNALKGKKIKGDLMP